VKFSKFKRVWDGAGWKCREFHYFEGAVHLREWQIRAVRRQIVRRVLKWQHSQDPRQRAEASRLFLRYREYF